MTSKQASLVPFVRGSDTSEAAALALDPRSIEAAVLNMIREHSNGLTDDEIEMRLSLPHQTVSARRRSLVLKRCVRDSGVRRKTRSGRYAVVWIAGAAEPLEGMPLIKRPARPSSADLLIALAEISSLAQLGKKQGLEPSDELRRLWQWLSYVAKEG